MRHDEIRGFVVGWQTFGLRNVHHQKPLFRMDPKFGTLYFMWDIAIQRCIIRWDPPASMASDKQPELTHMEAQQHDEDRLEKVADNVVDNHEFVETDTNFFEQHPAGMALLTIRTSNQWSMLSAVVRKVNVKMAAASASQISCRELASLLHRVGDQTLRAHGIWVHRFGKGLVPLILTNPAYRQARRANVRRFPRVFHRAIDPEWQLATLDPPAKW